MKESKKSSGKVTARHVAVWVSGYILSRFLKHSFISDADYAFAMGFLPSLLITIYLAIRARIRFWSMVHIAKDVEPGTSIQEIVAIQKEKEKKE